MSQYEQLRHFADSWGLLFLTVVFVGIVVWTLWPGRRRVHQDAASIPFRNEDRPAADPEAAPEGQEHHQAEDPRRIQL